MDSETQMVPKAESLSPPSRMVVTLLAAIQLKENFVTSKEERSGGKNREGGGERGRKWEARLGNIYQRLRELERRREKKGRREKKTEAERATQRRRDRETE